MKGLHIIAFILLIVGGLNWGLVGLGGEAWNVVALLGDGVARLVYVLVGLAALVELVTHKKGCLACGRGAAAPVGGAM
ncbi:MAG: DUF378 domain-containing protein [Patescibacteria group bacterium]